MDVPTIAAIVGVGAAVFSALWKLRKDEIDDLKSWMSLNITSRFNTIEPQIINMQAELMILRDWRHKFGQKETAYDEYGPEIDQLEKRLRELEIMRQPRDRP